MEIATFSGNTPTRIVFGNEYFYHYKSKTGERANNTGRGVKTALTRMHPDTLLEDFIVENQGKMIYVYSNPTTKSIYWKNRNAGGEEYGEAHILRAVAFEINKA